MAIYAAMVDRMDKNIGRVVKDLREAKELENTLIVFISDNGACAEWDPFGFDIKSSPQNILHKGDALQEMGTAGTFHSAGSGWANTSNTPWRMYKHYTHEGGINTPCIIHWPAQVSRQKEIDHHPGHIIDLLPTFCDVAGVEPSEVLKEALPGKSLMPLFTGKEQPPRTLFYEHEGHKAVHDGHWKLVAMKGKPWELYDIEKDRSELHDLASQHPEIVSRLVAQWGQWAEENQVTPLPDDYHVGYLKPDRQ